MATATNKKTLEFIEYVWSFYAPNDLYGSFFDNTLTKDEVVKAVEMRKKNTDKLSFDGDSMDREIVRDIMFYNRGKKKGLEYDISSFVA